MPGHPSGFVVSPPSTAAQPFAEPSRVCRPSTPAFIAVGLQYINGGLTRVERDIKCADQLADEEALAAGRETGWHRVPSL